MSENQIKEYLEKYQIKSKEGLAEHIEQLKKNTVPNVKLISELVYVLEDEGLVFNSFFRENSKIERRINSMFLDEILEQSNQNSSPTRHKSKEGETHTEVPTFTDRDIANIQALANLYKDDIKTIENNTKAYNFLDSFIISGYPKRGKIITYKTNQEVGKKENKNKPQMSLLFKQFPKALEAIVKCSEYGHNKYKETDEDFLNFSRVEGGSKSYADAGLRHRLQEGNDLESGLPHTYHICWNALAELELILQGK